MKILDKVFFRLSDKRRLGYVLKANSKTIWAKVMIGARNSIVIKRHIFKHNAKRYFTENNFYEKET